MCILCINPASENYPNLDSGATNHISGKSKWLQNLRSAKHIGPLRNAANKIVEVSPIGDMMSEHIKLYRVYLSNDLEDDELYVSIGQLTEEGYEICINT